MLDAHLRPGAERLPRRRARTAVGRITTRGRGRPVASSSPAVELCHRRKELTGADERHGSGHGAQHRAGAGMRSGEAGAAGCPWTPPTHRCTLGRRRRCDVTTSQRWTMLAASSARPWCSSTAPIDEPGAAARSARSCRPPRLDARGPDLRRRRLPRDPRRAAHLSGALADYYGRRRIFAIGLIGFGITSRAVRPRADARAAGRRPPAPGRGRRAARPGLARDPHRLFGGRPGPRVRHLGVRDVRHRPARARSSAACSSTP